MDAMMDTLVVPRGQQGSFRLRPAWLPKLWANRTWVRELAKSSEKGLYRFRRCVKIELVFSFFFLKMSSSLFR